LSWLGRRVRPWTAATRSTAAAAAAVTVDRCTMSKQSGELGPAGERGARTIARAIAQLLKLESKQLYDC
jgi:hypothetical protein